MERFKYYNTSEKSGKLPSPSSYQTRDKTFDLDVSKRSGRSFANGRDMVKKLYIDKTFDEAKKQLNPPAPIYTLPNTFGKEGNFYSIRKKLKRYAIKNDKDEAYYEIQRNMPGPGQYKQPDTVGRSQIDSRYASSFSNGFARANDRFYSPTKQKSNTDPGSYSPNATSTWNFPGSTKFGLAKTDILE